MNILFYIFNVSPLDTWYSLFVNYPNTPQYKYISSAPKNIDIPINTSTYNDINILVGIKNVFINAY